VNEDLEPGSSTPCADRLSLAPGRAKGRSRPDQDGKRRVTRHRGGFFRVPEGAVAEDRVEMGTAESPTTAFGKYSVWKGESLSQGGPVRLKMPNEIRALKKSRGLAFTLMPC